MSKQTVKIKEAKGRPMLTWVGKRPLRQVTAFPAQKIETFDPTNEADERNGGLLLHGDNKEVLAWLLANGYRGKVKLIYIDPPFDSGADYVRKVKLRGLKTSELAGEANTIGEQIQYSDIWANDNYLQFMFERLVLLRELLSVDGSIYVHCDYRKTHHLRNILDEVFGSENFANEIIWCYTRPSRVSNYFPRVHDNILFYSKTNNRDFNTDNIRIPYHEESLARSNRGAGVESVMGTAQGEDRLREEGKIPEDYWQIPILQGNALERTDYPTQKPEKILERIIYTSSSANDIVLDCFVGSGTTPAVAQKLGRRWIACDINKGAIQTTSKRLQSIIHEQIKRPPRLPLEGKDDPPTPSQMSFSVYRVNDYDLQIQRNEAMQLVMEHVGITSNTADPFFNGTRGKQLAKVVPFERPLTLLDLEEIKQELDNRPDESRGIVIVCLGKEMAVDGWLEDWNRLRKTENIPNKIEIIELRTDPRYGKFFVHEPAKARVNVTRNSDKLNITIEDFISPSIIERLKAQAGTLLPQIDDWRAMVDSVMIDTAYNGQVFNIALSDVPAKKDDLVIGSYELPAPDGETTVAVKITGMLGEEVLETAVV